MERNRWMMQENLLCFRVKSPGMLSTLLSIYKKAFFVLPVFFQKLEKEESSCV